MNSKTYLLIHRTLIIIEIFIVFVALWLGSAFIAFFGLGLGMILLSLLRLRVKGVLIDERQADIGEKAAQTSFKILLPVLGLSSLALLAAGGKQEFYYIQALGIILSYITCLGVFIYLVSWWFYNRKFGA